MSAIEFLWEPMWQRVGLALAHFLWQGLLIAVAAGSLVRLLCRHPTSRYAGYLLALLAMAGCPVVTFLALDAPVAAPLPPIPQTPMIILWDRPIGFAAGDAQGPVVASQGPAVGAPGPVAEWVPSWQERGEHWFQCALPWIVAMWLAGVVALSLRTILGFAAVRRWRRGLVDLPQEIAAQVPGLCRRLGMRRSRSVAISPIAPAAMAVGWLEPVVLLPMAMVAQMPPQLLRAVIAHELAHIRRLDAWVSLLQRVVEVVLFYHPAVWWLSARIRSQRELCCDELAVQATGEPVVYARALEKAGRGERGGQLAITSAFGQREHALLARVRHVLGLGERPRPVRPWLAGAVALASVAALMVAAGIAYCAPTTQSSDAATESADSPTSAPASSPGAASARIVHFPKDRSLGVLEIQDETEDQPIFDFNPRTSGWTSLGPAMGDVEVPAGKRLRLIVWPAEVANLPALRQLRPDDLYGLMVFAQEFGMGPTVLGPAHRVDVRAVAHLTGLRSLEMWEARRFDLNLLKGMKSLEHLKLVNEIDRSAEPSDADLAIISQLTSLRRLTVGGPRHTDRGIAHLTNLRGLQALWIYEANVTPAGLAQLSKLPALTLLGLASLKFNDDWLGAVRGIGSLKILHLGWLPVTDDGLRRLSGHPNLETLYLYHTGVTDAGMPYLRDLPSLKRLNLGSTRVGDAGARHLKEIKTLEELMMPNTVAWGEGPYAALTDTGLADLCELSNLRRLEWTSVGGNRSRECPVSDAGIAHLAKLKHLEKLTIAGTGITDEGMGTVATLAGLRELMIHVCPNVTEAGFAKLTGLGQLNTLDIMIEIMPAGALAHLDLPHLRILRVDDLVRGEAPLDISKLTALEDLTLSVQHGPGLRDEDLACLAGLTHLKRLQVSSRYLTDAGMAHLAGLTEMELLGVGGPNVTDEGLRYLEGMSRLNSLYLTVGSLGEDGVASLMKLQSLRLLTITSVQPVDQAALARLKAKLPTLISIENHKYKPPRKPRKSPPKQEAP
jgi:beta-lactamase regulating signal transducer with metallopeptidase domain